MATEFKFVKVERSDKQRDTAISLGSQLSFNSGLDKLCTINSIDFYINQIIKH